MKLNEAKMRMADQIESTNKTSALNKIYMTWRYASSQAAMFMCHKVSHLIVRRSIFLS